MAHKAAPYLATSADVAVVAGNVSTLQGQMATVEPQNAEMWDIGFAKHTLADADATVQPFTLKKSMFVMPPIMTANRTITFGNTSAPGAGILWEARVVRLDVSAFDLIIKKADGTTIYTISGTVGPSAGTPVSFFLFCNNGIWTTNTIIIVNG